MTDTQNRYDEVGAIKQWNKDGKEILTQQKGVKKMKKTVRIDIPCRRGEIVRDVEAIPTKVQGLYITPTYIWNGKTLKEARGFTITAMPSGLGIGVAFPTQRAARYVAAILGALFPNIDQWQEPQPGMLTQISWLKGWLMRFPRI